MNAPLRKVVIAALVMFGALLVNANVVQVGQASSLKNNPHNVRVLYAEYSHQRGPIVAGKSAVATSIATKDALKYLRTYGRGPIYAPITGWYSLTYGFSGIEQAENSILSGNSDKLFAKRISDAFTGRQPQGGAVVLTINPKVQQVAYNAMGGKRGAVVALDPRTGAILAMVSTPSYNPSNISTHSSISNTRWWNAYMHDPAQPMLNRAISQTYPPGSTFKVITTAAALASGKYNPNTVIPAPNKLTFPNGKPLSNFAGETCSPSQKETLRDALRQSCNTAYAKLGIAVGSDAIQKQAQAFGFGQALHIPMVTARSNVPLERDAPFVAQEAIGQHDDAVTPLQMAMVAAGIANHGVVMKPYVVAQERAPDSSVLSQAQPQELGRAVSESIASDLTSMMQTVVQNGTGTAAQIPGVAVAGKTGTAQHNGPAPYTWFISFAPAADPQVAVAVVVENTDPHGTGGTVAAPIAKQVMEAAIGG